ncbi:SDR family NAD(P)-dependent oxidoreductase [Aquimarina litoralis]|uniref:SDR family NAD(P)-dependent oxidoreductase n=1 Tax=Aquimarina litoralis TaxID=584605 RepID=UPI001C570537|nr:SDR family NAD(P)-dependent oxidoreductase [Aquimarina litoralis]MBW1294840.1 SDR family NAD(P)-dependent oxidoreductase [Aquimarina litoralis]
MKNLKYYVFIVSLTLWGGLYQSVAQVETETTDALKEGPQVIIITGTASGFGKATAKKLVAKGHIVYGGDLNVKGNAYLNKIGGYPLEMDVTNDEQVRAGIERIISEQGRIDVLINNAGYGEFATIENISIEDLKHQFDVNVFGYARLQQAVLPHMRKQRSGRVIIVSSVISKFSLPMLGWYSSTKHAVEGMADALRQEVAQFNIDVIKIQPGAANTGFGATAFARLEQSNVPEDYRALIDASVKSLENNFASAPGAEDTAETIVKVVELENPKITYITANAEGIVRLRKEMSEEDFYKMFSGQE